MTAKAMVQLIRLIYSALANTPFAGRPATYVHPLPGDCTEVMNMSVPFMRTSESLPASKPTGTIRSPPADADTIISAFSFRIYANAPSSANSL